MPPLSLRFVRSFYVRHSVIGGFLFVVSLLVAMMVPELGIWGLALPLVLLGLYAGFILRETRLAVRQVDEEGITRGDGTRLLWSDLQSIRDVHWIHRDGQRGAVNHVDLVFSRGRARVLHQVLENGWEAMQYARKRWDTMRNPVAPRQSAADSAVCSGCGMLGPYHFAMQKHGREDEDTFLPVCPALRIVREVRHPDEGNGQLEQCSACGAYFFFRSEYEYLATGSEETQIRFRLTAEEAARLG